MGMRDSRIVNHVLGMSHTPPAPSTMHTYNMQVVLLLLYMGVLQLLGGPGSPTLHAQRVPLQTSPASCRPLRLATSMCGGCMWSKYGVPGFCVYHYCSLC